MTVGVDLLLEADVDRVTPAVFYHRCWVPRVVFRQQREALGARLRQDKERAVQTFSV